MEITSITPAIKIVKEGNMTGCDIFVAFGDNIRVTDIEGRIFSGIFLYMDLAKSEDKNDSIVLNIGEENIPINCIDIKDIEEI